MISMVVVAGGRGRRMGGATPKQYLRLRGVEILDRALQVIVDSDLFHRIIVVVPPEDVASRRGHFNAAFSMKDQLQVVAGGPERQQSVYRGLLGCPAETRIVGVHDGVRPFLTRSLLQSLILTADRWGGAIAAVQPVDTLKTVDDSGTIVATVDRHSVWLAQTPQMFRYSLLKNAHDQAIADGFTGTDDAQLVERIGGVVRVVAGSQRNIKITRPDDVVMATAFIDDAANR
ncbi:MAG: 2-C-methyl-D-erythritol 4-phosphate cytidylyltransferase [Desulfobacterales bacterium]